MSLTHYPTCLHLTGSLDFASSAVLLEAVDLLDRTAPGGDVRVSLRNVDFIDASGIGALVRLATACRTRDRDIRFTGVSARLGRTFALAGAAWLLETTCRLENDAS